jgi:hypothetical protein
MRKQAKERSGLSNAVNLEIIARSWFSDRTSPIVVPTEAPSSGTSATTNGLSGLSSHLAKNSGDNVPSEPTIDCSRTAKRQKTSALLQPASYGAILQQTASCPSLLFPQTGQIQPRNQTTNSTASEKTAASSRGEPTFIHLDAAYPNQVFTILV